jgi:hypothetical protein
MLNFKKFRGGGVRDLGQGGGVIFSQGGGYHHPMAMYDCLFAPTACKMEIHWPLSYGVYRVPHKKPFF